MAALPLPRQKPQQQESRRQAKADGVTQAVELQAEHAGRTRKPGDKPVEHVEDVVEHMDTYDVVRKRPGEAGRIAEETDPRS